MPLIIYAAIHLLLDQALIKWQISTKHLAEPSIMLASEDVILQLLNRQILSWAEWVLEENNGHQYSNFGKFFDKREANTFSGK